MSRFKLMPIRSIITAMLIATTYYATAQVTGGQRTMEFLRLPNAPHISALGGINVANADRDISFALQNPALARPGLHNELGINYNAYYSGISSSNLQYGYHVEKIKTSFALGVQYMNYGNFTQTDLIGNQLGEFKANEFALAIAASRQYKERWRYGATLKWANSKLYNYTASALLLDVGISYYDSTTLWMVGAVAKNMGVMLSKYTATNGAEPLPFDLQIGVSKRLKYVPLRLMATAHHLYEWDVRYDNPADANNNNIFGGDSSTSNKSNFSDKLFRHLIFGAELVIAKRIQVSAAYNHMRRSELAIEDRTATTGFSFGAAIDLNKFQIHYARSYYHIAGAYNEFGLSMSLGKLMGLGKLGNKINWTDVYPDLESSIPQRPTPTSAGASGN